MRPPVDTVLLDGEHGGTFGVVVGLGRRRFSIATAIFMAVLGVFYLATAEEGVIQLLTGGLLLLQSPFHLFLAVRQNGLKLVVDDRGLRVHGEFTGWTTISWAAVTGLELEENGHVLRVHAPGGIERRGRVLDRDVHRFTQFSDLPTSTTRMLQYLEFRRARANGTATT